MMQTSFRSFRAPFIKKKIKGRDGPMLEGICVPALQRLTRASACLHCSHFLGRLYSYIAASDECVSMPASQQVSYMQHFHGPHAFGC